MNILKATKSLSALQYLSLISVALARDGKFPEPIPLTENRSGWLESDIDEWISECLRKHAGGKYAR